MFGMALTRPRHWQMAWTSSRMCAGKRQTSINNISIFKMTAAVVQFYFHFRSGDVALFRLSVYISKANFVVITQSVDEIWLLPVWKNKRPPYWNSTFGFDLDHFAVIGVSFCIRLPNFVQIGTFAAEIWRHIDFHDGGGQPCCICFGVMADHQQSAFCDLISVLKSLLRRIDSSGDIAI